MALIAGGGGGGRRAPTRQPLTPMSPWGDVYRRPAPTPAPSAWQPDPYQKYWPAWSQPFQFAAPKTPGVTISVSPEAAAPAWQPPAGVPAPAWGGGGGGGGGPSAPPAPGVSPPGGPAWWDMFQPFFEGAGAPQDLLKLRPQDWRSLPREVREQLQAWLRQFGWRPGGAYGRYGAREWQRGEGGQAWAEPGGYVGEQAFGGIPETLKPWIYWLASQKGWAAPGRERPETAGWGW